AGRDRGLFCFLGMAKAGQVPFVAGAGRDLAGSVCLAADTGGHGFRRPRLCGLWRDLCHRLARLALADRRAGADALGSDWRDALRSGRNHDPGRITGSLGATAPCPAPGRSKARPFATTFCQSAPSVSGAERAFPASGEPSETILITIPRE